LEFKTGCGTHLKLSAARTAIENKDRGKMMKGFVKREKFVTFSILAVTMTAALFVTACGSSSSGGSKPPVVGGITVYPDSATISENSTAQFTAYSGAMVLAPTWNVVSGTGTISGAGLFSAPGTTETDTIQAVSGSNASPQITINVVATQPVAVSPAAVAVPAGATQQFTSPAGCASTTWSVTSNLSANPGTITNGATNCGLYTAPLSPPPPGTVTITAMSGGNSGTSTVTILFSNASLNSLANGANTQPYAISYSAHNGSSFLFVAGSFIADGNGNITGGTEDINTSGATGPTSTSISPSTYTVGPDGRTTANITTGQGTGVVWQFVLTSNQHALTIRFDKSASGSGTIDQQNPEQFGEAFALGNYAFGLSGVDGKGHRTGTAGRVFANGNDTFPMGSGILDLNDSGATTTPTNVTDSELQGGFTTPDPSTGRGTLTLNCPSFEDVLGANTGIPGTLNFVYYVVDNTHLKVVESDSVAALGGDFYAAPATTVNMSGNQAFTVEGVDTRGHRYGMGGAFGSSGTGVLDLNDDGTLTSPPTSGTNVSSASPSVNANTGQIELAINLTSGTDYQFAAYLFNYTTASGLPSTGAFLLETDSNVGVGSGISYTQTGAAVPQGSFGLNLTGVGLNDGGEQDIEGQVTTASAGTVTGTVDINDVANSGNLISGEPLTSASAIAIVGIDGRGNPLTLANKFETNVLSYYVVDANTILLVEMDPLRVMTGTMALQF
jgi:hypothetical protein